MMAGLLLTFVLIIAVNMLHSKVQFDAKQEELAGKEQALIVQSNELAAERSTVADQQALLDIQQEALNAQQQKKSSTLAETLILIVVCLIAATAIVFAVYFFMQFNELKTDFDLQKDAAVAEAVAKQQDEDNAKFAEAEKLPYKQFSGPSDYGSISFEYPKTWNVYIDSDGLSNNSDFISYFRPEQVDSIKDSSSRFALRFKILNQQITNVQKQYDSKIQSGKMTSSIFNADNNNITGTKYVGEIDKDMNGIVVLIKVNDKTAIFQTDSMVYQQDFETLISKIRRNS